MIRALFFSTIFSFGVSYSLNSQSLSAVLDSISDQPISSQIKILDDIAWDTRNSNFRLAESFALKAHELSHQQENMAKKAITANTLGVIYRKLSDYEKSLAYYDTSLFFYRQLENIKQQAVIHHNLSNVYRAIGLPDSSKSHALISLSYARKINDSIRITGVLTSLGNLSMDQNKYHEAFNYYKECLDIDFALKDSLYCSIDLSNMADIMLYTGQYQRSYDYYQQSLAFIKGKKETLNELITYTNIGSLFQKQELYDSALSNFQISHLLALEIKDSIGLAFTSNEIGQIYYLINQYDLAKRHYNKALSIATSINEPTQIAHANYGIGKIYVDTGKPQEGLEYLKIAHQKGLVLQNANLLIESLEAIAYAYSAIGDMQHAFEALRDYTTKNDSLNNANLLATVADLETKYDTERKEQEIELLSTRNKLQTATIERNRLIIVLVAVSFLLSAGVLITYFRQRNYKLKAQFEGEKAELKSEQIKAVIHTQEAERKRFAMDLHDNFGQLISALRLITSQTKETKSSSDQLLDKMYTSLKNIAFDLMPTTLVQKDIIAAIEELATQVNQSDLLKVEVKSFVKELGFNKEQEIGIYRIIQELTNNIIKHAQAKNINIDFTQLDHMLQVMITDDGVGYDPNQFYQSNNNGWKNIRSRLDLIEGDLEIDSSVDSKGSTVIISIPLYKVTQAA